MAVNVVGGYCSAFGRFPHLSYKALTAEVVHGVLADARLPDGRDVGEVWFGNCTLHRAGQSNIRGQACLAELQRSGTLPARVAVMNVENACATGSTALYGAMNSVLSGRSQLALAIGVEKLFPAGGGRPDLRLFDAGMDQLDPQAWIDYYEAAARSIGRSFERGPERSVAMDTYAIQAAFHMREYGTTVRQLAMAAAQTHNFGAMNPLAQYRYSTTPEAVMADRPVTYPFTRAMCAPISDGGAAVLVCSDEYLHGCPTDVRDRAIRILACECAGGKLRDWREDGLSRAAAVRAYQVAGLKPADVSLAEVHDATAFSLIYQAEMLGFCEPGRGGQLVESGQTGAGGRIPINTSGGLISKGHPVGATGIGMIYELLVQLRGEAGARQVANASIALAENGGGVMGFDEAVCFVTLLGRTS